MGKGPYKGVIHCFTASGDFADNVLALGFYISISGIVTFKNAKDLQITAARLPRERLLIETDSPFLAPVPHRGKSCEPDFVDRKSTSLKSRHYSASRMPYSALTNNTNKLQTYIT